MNKARVHLYNLLILAVTIVLLAMLLNTDVAIVVVLAVTVVLITLIMVVGEAAHYLANVLHVVLDAIRRIIS